MLTESQRDRGLEAIRDVACGIDRQPLRAEERIGRIGGPELHVACELHDARIRRNETALRRSSHSFGA